MVEEYYFPTLLIIIWTSQWRSNIVRNRALPKRNLIPIRRKVHLLAAGENKKKNTPNLSWLW